MAPMASRHVFHLEKSEPYYKSALGSIQRCTADHLPILKNMSIKKLVLQPKAIREPHWHANANELTYCLSGSALVSVLDTGSAYATFVVSQGEMFHAKSGSLHHIENVSDTEPAVFIVAFRHERPEDFSFGAALGTMSPAVLGNTFNVKSSAFKNVNLSTEDKHIVPREGPVTIPETAYRPDPHKFNVEGMEPPLNVNGAGYVKPARAQFWPALDNMAMYSLTVEDSGMREPHWHPITGEMGYVHRGTARMSILDPDGTVDTYMLEAGDVYFVPAAYPHQIEVVGSPDIHFLIFFDQKMPQDVGYKASANAMPHEAMAATLGMGLAKMPHLETAETDPLIVKRVNPVDPQL